MNVEPTTTKRKRQACESSTTTDIIVDDEEVPNSQNESTEIDAQQQQALEAALSKDATHLDIFSGRKPPLHVVPQCLVSVKNSYMFTKLRSLDLSRNQIKELPATLCTSLTSLEHLNMARNFLRRVPVEIVHLTQLQTLDVSSNQFKGLPDLELGQLSKLSQLRVLDVRRNGRIGEYGANHAQLIQEQLNDGRSNGIEVLISTKTHATQHAADRDGTLLESQLAPHCTGVLRRRLALAFGETTDPDKVERQQVMERLLYHYAKAPVRAIRHVKGVPVQEELCAALMAHLEAWVAADVIRRQSPTEVRERPTIQASHYMILTSTKTFANPTTHKAKRAQYKLDQHLDLWNAARDILRSVDADFCENCCTAIAFTKNFVGSPHIDTQNIGPFYGLAMGDFSEGGGALCVEVSTREIAHVDTRNRLGRVDGRYPHWVAPYTGDRYSVIYYHTKGDVIPRGPAVFSGTSPLETLDPATFATKEDNYYNKYDRKTGKYEPSA